MEAAESTALAEIPEAEMPDDKLAVYRKQVAGAEPSKMSEVAILKFRTIKEQDRVDAIGGERFKNGLSSIEATPANLRKLIERCSCKPETHRIDKSHIERRVAKLGWWSSAGYKLGREIDTVTLIHFFSDLVPDEIEMTDGQFAACWNVRSAQKRLKSRIEREIIPDEKPDEKPDIVQPKAKEKLCKAGKKCLWIKHRKPAPAVGKSAYCTPICGQADRNRQKRSADQFVTQSVMPSGSESDLSSPAPL